MSGLPDRRPIVAVIGASQAVDTVLDMAFDVGGKIARRGWHLICGGGSGVMEASCRGFVESREDPQIRTIGLLPSDDSQWANPYVEIVIPSGMGWARNAVITRTAHGVIAIGGCSGTLTEIAFAWQMGKPIAALKNSGGWSAELAGRAVDERRQDEVFAAATASDAAAFIDSQLTQ